MNFLNTVLFAFLGGVLPALVWLSFWLKEDTHPEPPQKIFRAFLYGMVAVPFALLFQFFISSIFLKNIEVASMFAINLPIALIAIILWAGIEELVKYYAAFNSGINTKDNNEPIDATIYLIAAALGFSALENTLFIFWPILAGDSTTAFMTGNMRFIGATLLHVATSSIIGVFISFTYYAEKKVKRKYVLIGFIFAVILHTVFNSFLIMMQDFTLISFSIVWIVIVLIIMLLEKIKTLYFKPKKL